jgi:hypothetical protein
MFTGHETRKKNNIFYVKINKQFDHNEHGSPRSHIAEYRPLASESHVHSIGHFLMLFVCGRAIKAMSVIIVDKSLIIFPANEIRI